VQERGRVFRFRAKPEIEKHPPLSASEASIFKLPKVISRNYLRKTARHF
jgi:hypothetical protein